MNSDSREVEPGLAAGTRRKQVLVWAVYPSGAGWRGEGISQSIENILLHSPDTLDFTLILSAEHRQFAEEVLAGKSNVTIVPFGVQLRRMKEWGDRRVLVKSVGPADDLLEKAARGTEWLVDRIMYLVLKFAGPLGSVSVRKHIRAADVIFNPSPVYCYTRNKKKRKLFGFWDPFVFEYTDFGKTRFNAIRSFMYRFIIRANKIVTQSEANRQYLVNVWSIPEEQICVIHNGSPDYSNIYNEYLQRRCIASIDRANIFDYWPRRKLKGYKKADAAKVLFNETLNESILFRLQMDLLENSKIIVVSTQYRPYKGFELLFSLLDYLLAQDTGIDFRFIFTAELPEKVRAQFGGKYAWFTERTYELTRLSNLQHACLYSISDLVLHPSLVEGGPTLYPASEAASVGVPSLTNSGRHTAELLARDGAEMTVAISDFMDKRATAARILEILNDPSAANAVVSAINSNRFHWNVASKMYADVLKNI